MRLIILPALLLLISCQFQNQSITDEKVWEKNELMAHIRFLASNELKGRKTGEPETKIAARYIAEQFRAAGLKSFNFVDNYMQPTEFVINDERKTCNNVVGFIEGSNTTLRNEYILLCAHYDHLGIIKNIKTSASDSIYNGARDNAMGTTALIYAAKELSKQKTERSIIFLATTGEEQGMFGSWYFFEHCPVSINKIVFVLNNDGGGYNDTTKIRIGGKNEINFLTGFWDNLGNTIDCLPYPAELDYLYEKGDNITFAKNGIPSITISPGFEKIDEAILKYIHKPEDEANDDFDYNYLFKFSRFYAECALKIINSTSVPFWKKDSKYFPTPNKFNKNEPKSLEHFFLNVPFGDSVVLFLPEFFGEYTNTRDIAFLPDYTEFYFTHFSEDTVIKVSKFESDKWTTPVTVEFSGKYCDLEPFIAPDGKSLYFASKRPSKTKTSKNDIDIWKVTRDGKSWCKPQPLNNLINTNCMEYYPSVSKSGDIYFGRNDAALTRGDIYSSQLIDSAYSFPVKLPKTVNLPTSSFNAFISPDENYILFSAYIQENDDWHSDLFISYIDVEESWGVPVNLGKNINSKGNDISPWVSYDNKFLFFSSTRLDISNVNHKIFWIKTSAIPGFNNHILSTQ